MTAPGRFRGARKPDRPRAVREGLGWRVVGEGQWGQSRIGRGWDLESLAQPHLAVISDWAVARRLEVKGLPGANQVKRNGSIHKA